MRHVYVNARLTPTEKSMIEAEASRRDKSPSAYAGDLLRGALAGEMTVEAGLPPEILAAARREADARGLSLARYAALALTAAVRVGVIRDAMDYMREEQGGG
jgi:hypothetical protein